MDNASRISVELVYINPPRQAVLKLVVPAQATIKETIMQSGILQHFPEIELDINKVGIYNEIRELDEVVQAGDRIEIYRALKADPKEARRQRAQLKKAE